MFMQLLKDIGIRDVESTYLDRRSVAECLSEADRRHMEFVVIIGKTNEANETVSLKKMFGSDKSICD